MNHRVVENDATKKADEEKTEPSEPILQGEKNRLAEYHSTK